jgi:3-oxoacyl-(acyl-carrier-protein) synthase
LARIAGYGAATETGTMTGISTDGHALQTAILQALEQAELSPSGIDLIVGHGAGTRKGDEAEFQAYRAVFGEEIPQLTFHKWMTGHMFGASAACSVALAVEHMLSRQIPALPYWPEAGTALGMRPMSRKIEAILVAALGFGGNAAALVLTAA